MRLVLLARANVLNLFKLPESTYFWISCDLNESQQLLGAAFAPSSQTLCLLGVVVSELTSKLAVSFLAESCSSFDRVLLFHAESLAWIQVKLVLKWLTKQKGVRLLRSTCRGSWDGRCWEGLKRCLFLDRFGWEHCAGNFISIGRSENKIYHLTALSIKFYFTNSTLSL